MPRLRWVGVIVVTTMRFALLIIPMHQRALALRTRRAHLKVGHLVDLRVIPYLAPALLADGLQRLASVGFRRGSCRVAGSPELLGEDRVDMWCVDGDDGNDLFITSVSLVNSHDQWVGI